MTITRPAHQAEGLAGLLAAAGADVIRFPVLAIAPVPLPEGARTLLRELPKFSMLVFVSANAVEHGLPLIRQHAPGGDWTVAAVGRATARALEAQGAGPVLIPPGRYDSEGLLDLPALQPEAVGGRAIAIVRGEGGRAVLGDTLRARGAARVEYLEVYRRTRPDTDPGPLRRRCAAGEVDAVLLSSAEGLENLVALLGEAAAECLTSARLVVATASQAARARELGASTLVAPGADDASMVQALVDWRRTGAPGGAARG